MKKAGLQESGVAWTQAEGTLWDGRITGLEINGHEIGDTILELRPLSLLLLAPVYDVQWGGTSSRGSAIARISRKELYTSDLSAEQNISYIKALAVPVRAMGGSVRVNGAHIVYDWQGCTSASGKVSSDVLSLAAEKFGRSFPILTGDLGCDAGTLTAHLTGTSDKGDVVEIDLRASQTAMSGLTARVDTKDREVVALLANSGFALQDGRWTYSRDTPPSGLDMP